MLAQAPVPAQESHTMNIRLSKIEGDISEKECFLRVISEILDQLEKVHRASLSEQGDHSEFESKLDVLSEAKGYANQYFTGLIEHLTSKHCLTPLMEETQEPLRNELARNMASTTLDVISHTLIDEEQRLDRDEPSYADKRIKMITLCFLLQERTLEVLKNYYDPIDEHVEFLASPLCRLFSSGVSAAVSALTMISTYNGITLSVSLSEIYVNVTRSMAKWSAIFDAAHAQAASISPEVLEQFRDVKSDYEEFLAKKACLDTHYYLSLSDLDTANLMFSKINFVSNPFVSEKSKANCNAWIRNEKQRLKAALDDWNKSSEVFAARRLSIEVLRTLATVQHTPKSSSVLTEIYNAMKSKIEQEPDEALLHKGNHDYLREGLSQAVAFISSNDKNDKEFRKYCFLMLHQLSLWIANDHSFIAQMHLYILIQLKELFKQDLIEPSAIENILDVVKRILTLFDESKMPSQVEDITQALDGLTIESAENKTKVSNVDKLRKELVDSEIQLAEIRMSLRRSESERNRLALEHDLMSKDLVDLRASLNEAELLNGEQTKKTKKTKSSPASKSPKLEKRISELQSSLKRSQDAQVEQRKSFLAISEQLKQAQAVNERLRIRTVALEKRIKDLIDQNREYVATKENAALVAAINTAASKSNQKSVETQYCFQSPPFDLIDEQSKRLLCLERDPSASIHIPLSPNIEAFFNFTKCLPARCFVYAGYVRACLFRSLYKNIDFVLFGDDEPISRYLLLHGYEYQKSHNHYVHKSDPLLRVTIVTVLDLEQFCSSQSCYENTCLLTDKGAIIDPLEMHHQAKAKLVLQPIGSLKRRVSEPRFVFDLVYQSMMLHKPLDQDTVTQLRPHIIKMRDEVPCSYLLFLKLFYSLNENINENRNERHLDFMVDSCFFFDMFPFMNCRAQHSLFLAWKAHFFLKAPEILASDSSVNRYQLLASLAFLPCLMLLKNNNNNDDEETCIKEVIEAVAHCYPSIGENRPLLEKRLAMNLRQSIHDYKNSSLPRTLLFRRQKESDQNKPEPSQRRKPY